MRIALVSRELYPFGGGGIGQFASATATLLSECAEVTLLTSSTHRAAYLRALSVGDHRLAPRGVRVEFVPEPTLDEAGPWSTFAHLYSARVYERLRELYPDGGPDVLEFGDYAAEAFVTLQAAQALDRFLTRTCICVRVHTSSEICAILNGHSPGDQRVHALYAMERFTLAHADRLIWQGGDVLGTYERFYGTRALAPAVRIRYPYRGPVSATGADAGFSVQPPLRVLYAGRLERRKGVAGLVRAATGLPGDEFRLTLLGSDTDTGPLGVSVRETLELAITGDSRVTLIEPGSREAVASAICAHDVVVMPSLWECWPYAALEALHLGRPVLATPVGGLVELVVPGVSGWLARGCDAPAIAQALRSLLDDPQAVAALVRSGAPSAHARALSDEGAILDGYRALAQVQPRSGAGANGRRARGRGRLDSPIGELRAGQDSPLVSAIVPYYRASRFVAETIDSLLAQSYARIEIVLVNDGSFEEADWIVAELCASRPIIVVSQMNAGLGAARNYGVAQSRGRYVLPLDADNTIEPEFVQRCVEVLEARPEVAYATTWSRYVDEHGTPLEGLDLGYQPLGNHAEAMTGENFAGDAAAVIRRRLLRSGFAYSEELTSFEDWHLYRELARAGHFGVVIPERLLRYRVRPDSMLAEIGAPRRERLREEIEAHIRENALRWTSSSA
ncbi:MAG: glycosyltransferase [Solirubrobacteraceae bacterium]